MSKFIRDRYVWYIAILLGIIVIFTFIVEQVLFGKTLEESDWHPVYMAIRNFMFLGVVFLSAWRFGFKGGLAIGLAIGLIELPHVVAEIATGEHRIQNLIEFAIFAPVGVGVAWLVGTRRQAEKKLADSEVKYRRLFETTRDAILILNKDSGQITDANPFIKDLLGYSLEELKGKNLWEIGELKDTLANKISYQELSESGYKRWDNLTLIAKDGRKVSVEIIANAYRVDHTRIIQCNIRDITERKQVEETIRLQAELLDKELDSVCLHDFEGNFTYVNKAACVTHGYTKEELLNIKLSDLDDPESAKLIAPRMKEIFEKGEATFEVNHFHKNGSLIPLEIHVSKTEVGGKPMVMMVGREITERRKMQQQLMAQDRLASIGQLVSGVAHELNNPLTSVVGFSDLVLQRELPDDLKADLKIVNDEAKRTALIVRNLLSFARQQPQEKQSISINEPIKTVLQLRSHEQSINNIKVITNFASELPKIMGNASQLQQVFFNLIVNAEQAMLEAHNRGTLTITTERVGDIVKARFTDDGPGIGPENMKRLFTPFFTTKEIGKGTGLGLSICHGIVTEHGGKIYAESEPGKGATFIIELPIKKVEVNQERAR